MRREVTPPRAPSCSRMYSRYWGCTLISGFHHRAEPGELGAQRLHQRCGGYRIEDFRARPVIGPGMLSAQFLGLIGISRDHVRVKRGLEVAEDGVVDAQRCTGTHQ